MMSLRRLLDMRVVYGHLWVWMCLHVCIWRSSQFV